MNILLTELEKYGREYQLNQEKKYRDRKNNHWKIRIELAKKLVEMYSLPRLGAKETQEIIVVDVGCSIGTFAIEFAKMGYKSFGIDFDSSAIEIAKKLACEENVSPVFVIGDVSDWKETIDGIDIAIFFDIFEHLHDDELGSLLKSIKNAISKGGSVVFHTFPTQYDYMFFGKKYLRWGLIPFKYLSPSKFNLITKAYASLYDIALLFKKGSTYKELMKVSRHCNPLTSLRLKDILGRAGYELLFLESSNLYDEEKSIQKQFRNQPMSYRNLYGVAIPSDIRV